MKGLEEMKWWDKPKLLSKSKTGKLCSMKDGLIASGNRNFNVDQLLESEYGKALWEMYKPFYLSNDPMDDKVVEYWRQRGMKKELVHGGPQDWNNWAIFSPIEADSSEGGEKYPLMLGLHGGGAGPDDGATVFLTENCGYAQKAASEKFILALPDDHDDAGIMRLYNYMVEHYPVDRTRVYLAGFSAGSNRSVQSSLMHPELFSGILVGAGLPFSLEYDQALIENARKYKMPMVAVGCLCDKGNHTPFTSTNPVDNPMPAFIAKLFTAENKMRWTNAFFYLNHIPYWSIEENKKYVQEKGTEVEKRLGFRGQKTWKYAYKGVDHYCSSYMDDENMETARYVFIDRMPHAEPPDMLDIGWDFLKRYSRDPETKELRCK